MTVYADHEGLCAALEVVALKTRILALETVVGDAERMLVHASWGESHASYPGRAAIYRCSQRLHFVLEHDLAGNPDALNESEK
jgi:hypothetical protein